MRERTSALYSPYIIDGVRMEFTPDEMLRSVSQDSPLAPSDVDAGSLEPIVDESTDINLSSGTFYKSKINKYLSLLCSEGKKQRIVPSAYSGSFTKGRIAKAFGDILWQRGHFRLLDIEVSIGWSWNPSPLGSMASFYKSVEAACDYLDALGVRLSTYSFREASGNFIDVRTGLSGNSDEEDPFKTLNPWIGKSRKCSCKIGKNESDWIIYVPMDTCRFRLGGSLLSEVTSQGCGLSPEINDPDYLIDSFELLRELVEDGIVTSGVTVGDGGMMTALEKALGQETGAVLDLSGLKRSYSENDIISLLFGEIPGVIIEINDNDYDYVDAEFLLQDVAYYPIGHPCKGKGDIRMSVGNSGGIAGILQSLLSAGVSEGED